MKKLSNMIDNLKARRAEMNKEEGFSLLELVVAVGILLVLTVGGILAYNGITNNAKKAATESAASQVLTAALAYENDADPKTDANQAAWEYNKSAETNKGKISVMVSGVAGSPVGVQATNSDLKEGGVVQRGENGFSTTFNAPTDPATGK